MRGRVKLASFFLSVILVSSLLFYFRFIEKEKSPKENKEVKIASQKNYIREERFGLLFPKEFSKNEAYLVNSKENAQAEETTSKSLPKENLTFKTLSPETLSNLDEPILGRVIGKIVEVSSERVVIKVDSFRGFEESKLGKKKKEVLTLPKGTIITATFPLSLSKNREGLFEKGKTIIATLRFLPAQQKERVILLDFEVFGMGKGR